MHFILWSKLIVKSSCNKEILAVATYCLAKYWWRTKRLVRITFKLPQGSHCRKYDIVTKSIDRFPSNKTAVSSAYFMLGQKESFNIQYSKKSHHSDQLNQRQYPLTTDNINVPQIVYKIRLRVTWSKLKVSYSLILNDWLIYSPKDIKEMQNSSGLIVISSSNQSLENRSVSGWRNQVNCVHRGQKKRGQLLKWSRGWEMKNATVMLKRRRRNERRRRES